MRIDFEHAHALIERYPELRPYIYQVRISKDGCVSKQLFKGTKEECVEFVKRYKKGKQSLWDRLGSDKEFICLHNGYYLHIEIGEI